RSKNVFVLSYVIADPRKIEEDDNRDHIFYTIVQMEYGKCLVGSLHWEPRQLCHFSFRTKHSDMVKKVLNQMTQPKGNKFFQANKKEYTTAL
ncbi:hypothetical protein M8C21_027871, partial [Ambrosia artemisiifolia]